mmetsp:Transcript_11114/g.11201  ORF Transcript_11114/g.11201 Transcript_11114/m.11201 type:complete len:260 (-) Transcript_11114:82-861(-)
MDPEVRLLLVFVHVPVLEHVLNVNQGQGALPQNEVELAVLDLNSTVLELILVAIDQDSIPMDLLEGGLFHGDHGEARGGGDLVGIPLGELHLDTEGVSFLELVAFFDLAVVQGEVQRVLKEDRLVELLLHGGVFKVHGDVLLADDVEGMVEARDDAVDEVDVEDDVLAFVLDGEGDLAGVVVQGLHGVLVGVLNEGAVHERDRLRLRLIDYVIVLILLLHDLHQHLRLLLLVQLILHLHLQSTDLQVSLLEILDHTAPT